MYRVKLILTLACFSVFSEATPLAKGRSAGELLERLSARSRKSMNESEVGVRITDTVVPND